MDGNNNNNYEPSGRWAVKERLRVAEPPLELLSSDRAMIGPAPVSLEPRLQQQPWLPVVHHGNHEDTGVGGHGGCVDQSRGLRCSWKGAGLVQGCKELPGRVSVLAELPPQIWNWLKNSSLSLK